MTGVSHNIDFSQYGYNGFYTSLVRMTGIFDIWRMLAGVAIFLFGMSLLENAIKNLSGRRFKLFLRRQTSKKVQAIAGGAAVTAVLQSSSVVNLMVLAFVGAGIITMQNALAVVLGANVGTTIDTWFVATAGFKFNIEAYAFPLAGVGGIAAVLFKKDSKWYHWSTFAAGLGFLFIGLDFMKLSIRPDGMLNFPALEHYPAIVFVLTGLVITSIIQSSSATIAIVLSVLNAHAISFYMATAIVLGSEIGTSVKLLLASSDGMSIKKRVALGNFLFNIISTSVILIFLKPVNTLIAVVIGIRDPLIGLAFFQTFINVVSVVIFYPFLNLFGKWLESRYTNDGHVTLYIHKIGIADIELATGALENETKNFLYHVIQFCHDVFHSNEGPLEGNALHKDYLGKELAAKYEYIKHMHGDMYNYYLQLQNAPGMPEETQRLDIIASALRNGMHAAKGIKDTQPDILQLYNSSNDIKFRFYEESRTAAITFYKRIQQVIEGDKQQHYETLVNIYKVLLAQYDDTLKSLYKEERIKDLSEVEISTVINFNREMYGSYKALVLALKDFLLPAADAERFDELPLKAIS